MISTTIPIQGTFDIAKGRNSIRAHIAAQRWSPTFGARVAAALTALGELILYTNRNNLVIVRMNVHEEGDTAGIEFVCTVQIPEGDLRAYQDAEARLARATDDLDLRKVAQNIHICAIIRL